MLDIESKRNLIDRGSNRPTIKLQCELLDLPRSTLYYQPCTDSPRNIELMRLIDEVYTEYPEYGSRRIRFELNEMGYPVGRDLVRTLMQRMGIETVYPKPNLSKSDPEHKIYPYLLRGVKIERINQVYLT